MFSLFVYFSITAFFRLCGVVKLQLNNRANQQQSHKGVYYDNYKSSCLNDFCERNSDSPVNTSLRGIMGVSN